MEYETLSDIPIDKKVLRHVQNMAIVTEEMLDDWPVAGCNWPKQQKTKFRKERNYVNDHKVRFKV